MDYEDLLISDKDSDGEKENSKPKKYLKNQNNH